MNRRRFLGLAGTAALATMTRGPRFAWSRALAGPAYPAAGAAPAPTPPLELPHDPLSPQAGPLVAELIHIPELPGAMVFRTDPPDAAAFADLLDRLLSDVLDRPDELPLDLWAELFPEEQACGVKVRSDEPGAVTGALAGAIVARLLDVDVPPAKVTVWDRAAPDPAALGLAVPADRAPRLRAAGAEGWSRPLRPVAAAGSAGRWPRLSKLVEGMGAQATVTPLAAGPDGRMAPFVIESLALGAAEWKGTPPDGATAARWASDAALASRARLHLADLWTVPLGRTADGAPKEWRARTILVSTDPVALTAVGHALLAGARAGNGLGPTPAPGALAEAARLGLGKGALEAIRWRKWSF